MESRKNFLQYNQLDLSNISEVTDWRDAIRHRQFDRLVK